MTDKESKRLIQKYLQPFKCNPSGYAPVLAGLHNIKVVFFDVYGTLLFSDHSHLSEKSRLHLTEMIDRYSLGYSTTTLLAELKDEITRLHSQGRAKGIAYPEIDIVAVWEKIFPACKNGVAVQLAFEFEMITNRIAPTGNIKALMGYLKKHNIRIGIISNAQFYTEAILRYFLGASFWKRVMDPQLIFYSYQYGIAKPAHALFAHALQASEALGFEATNVLFIGNDPVCDIAPATEIGFKTALFAGDKSCLREETTAYPQPGIIITDWKQIKKIIT